MRPSSKPNHIILFSIIVVMAFIACNAGELRKREIEKQKAIEIRLQQLEDREEIRQLFINYGRYLDQRNFAAFSRLFAERDGEWSGGMGKARGHHAIRRLMEQSIGTNTVPQSASFHLFTNEFINLAGDRATATTKWVFVVRSQAGRPQPALMGHYEDDLVRENGHWKFSKRAVYADIPTDDQLKAGEKQK